MSVKYADDVQFLLVYIREAHASDQWQVKANERQGVIFAAAQNFEEKEHLATACVRKLGIDFTTVVDSMDNQTELNYTAWPDRLYLVGRDGTIKFKGGPGPGGFRPKELETAIRVELGLSEAPAATDSPKNLSD